ncbi:ATP-binding protein [Terasakiella sp. A23]|uniref:PAS domain-containing hybrid sensor histidine kinase/response regulator n=1 Tax=Terasakiella sp. FCG-A23 TaxID=3080561 RepID=UPI002953DEEC|nr:ATP-binding protein [Terasakiella sp. A23]MDV7339394.1 ATP-binding protein [Terasakiella sp. A23]
MSAIDQSSTITVLEEKVKKLQEELDKSRLSEKRFLDALRLSPMALCHHDQNLRYTWLYNGHMGFVQDEVIGKTDWDILGNELADRMGVIKRRVLETGIGERVEMQTVDGDENSEYFDLVVEPLRDDFTGAVVGLSCSGIDVTEDRRRREAYKASEENLKFIFNASPMPIVVSHFEDGRPLFYNKAADDLFNLSKAPTDNFLASIGQEDDVNAMLAADKLVEAHRFEYKKWLDKPLYLTISATNIFYNADAAVLCTFHDLTRETVYQQHLQEAKEKAELASIAKSQFLASASHDLRQPLHAMGLLLSVLEQYIEDGHGKKVLEHVTTSLEAMNELFSGILDISKLDADAVPVEMQTVRIPEIFKTLETDFTPMAENAGLDIRFVRSSCHVKSDPVQVERILRNLLSNALRYTSSGRVLVGCRRRGSEIEFCVHDTGVGIAEEDLKRIFEEFRQVENPERDRRKGLGLGLAICDRVATLLNTEIEVKSQKGVGSSFCFRLPMMETVKKVKEKSRGGDLSLIQGRTILFIEDEVDVQTAIQYMIEAWGCEPIIASSLDEARKLLNQNMVCPDAIVADYRLRDEENGLDIIKAIRQDFKKRIPAIVVSGDTDPDLIKQMQIYGLQLLNKPILPDVMQQRLLEMLTD